jgi:hypothetical protein
MAKLAAFPLFPEEYTHSLYGKLVATLEIGGLLGHLENAKMAKTANMAMSAITGAGGHLAGQVGNQAPSAIAHRRPSSSDRPSP